MTFNELKEWLGTCPDHKWEVEEIWWPEENDGSTVVRFKIEREEY